MEGESSVGYEGRRAKILQLILFIALAVPILVSSQPKPKQPIRSIADPDFPCGLPWGPNGERPTEDLTPSRVMKRQIIFPDEKEYNTFIGILMSKGNPVVDPKTRPGTEDVGDAFQDTVCGSAVISDRFILTAAHCALNERFPIDSVRLGDIDLDSEHEAISKPADYYIREIIPHPLYNQNDRVRYNDLALLMTYNTIQFNNVVYPRCIPNEPPTPGSIVTASGYGLYNATTTSNHLLEADFIIVDTKECEDLYIKEGLDVQLKLQYPKLLQGSDIICAKDNISDSCQGDSGGPVTQIRDGKEYLVGLVASGANCQANFKPFIPGLYLSLAHHVPFISAVLYDDKIPPPEVPDFSYYEY